RAEDRERFQQMIQRLQLRQPNNSIVKSAEEGISEAAKVGYPLVVRPSYVLGGRAMEIVYNEDELKRYLREAVQASNEAPVLLDHFLDDATEVDVDCVSDGKDVVIGGIMQHIEQAGIHSGDSACSIPPYSLSKEIQDEMRRQTIAMAKELGVVGLMNVQFAVKGNDIYVLEVNPRASRTVPFVSKCIGESLAKVAARCMAGQSLESQGFTKEIIPNRFAVKEAVFPFAKFPGVDPMLGPEMKSTGEVMGVGQTFGEAFYKAVLGSNDRLPGLPTEGEVKHAFLSVRESDKKYIADIAKKLVEYGFKLVATGGTYQVLKEAGLECESVNKVTEGRPHIVDRLKNGEIHLIVNTTEGKQAQYDSAMIRRAALQGKVYYTTTINGAEAVCQAFAVKLPMDVYRLQDLTVG
ncbi:carbamoyl phosphate synthase large subunit, partial [Acinetobacter baumannii]